MFGKWMVATVAACLLCGGMAYASETETEITADAGIEAVSSASVTDYYGDYGLAGDELMEAINSPSGSYVISTVNEDGTPQVGFFVYSMLKDGDTYYLQLGLAENQTRVNLERTGQAMALYAANPEEDANAQYAVAGARMERTIRRERTRQRICFLFITISFVSIKSIFGLLSAAWVLVTDTHGNL